MHKDTLTVTTQEAIKKWDNFSKFHVQGSVNQITTLLEGKKDVVVIDVGANSGTFFDALSEKVDIKRAILFEPHPELFLYLKYKYQHDRRITVENIALSDSAKNYSLDETRCRWNVESNSDTDNTFNLGLVRVNYDINSNLKTDSFDNLRKRYNLEKIDLIKIDTETEDLFVLKGFTETIKELKDKPVIEVENNWWEKYTYEESKKLLDDFCKITKYENSIDLNQKGDFYLYPEEVINNEENTKVTIVTGLWDLKRGDLEGWGKRDFQHYKNCFFTFLKTNIPMVIYIPKELEEEVLSIRKNLPTFVILKEVKDFETWNPFYNKIDQIRKSEEWNSIADWLSESPQGGLQHYNPMMFTKVFMVNDAAILNPFNTAYFYWIDGGITNTVPEGYFLEDKVLSKLENYTKSIDNKLIHLVYRYTSNSEIHGFKRKEMARYCGVDFVDTVSRGGFFGGHKKKIAEYNRLYYTLMESTLKENLMGADESLFTILRYKHPKLIHSFYIEDNGLVWPFFEMLKNFDSTKTTLKEPYDDVGLYVLSFNSPRQFDTLCNSMYIYDNAFLNKTNKYLINNSLDTTTFEEYEKICKKYNFIEIRKENIGICGGRQFVAEHAEASKFKYHLFFEDDMFFYTGEDTFCKNGFRRNIKNLFDIVVELMEKEDFDFLKFNFTEFFGDNSRQWSWHNVPADVRKVYFPDNPIKDERNNTPSFLNFEYIKSHREVPYATGEIFYCNWPQIVSYKGNKKMFLETKWDYPYEQTWMSFIFQETKKGAIKPGLLLATPTEHNRFHHYKKEDRREN